MGCFVVLNRWHKGISDVSSELLRSWLRLQVTNSKLWWCHVIRWHLLMIPLESFFPGPFPQPAYCVPRCATPLAAPFICCLLESASRLISRLRSFPFLIPFADIFAAMLPPKFIGETLYQISGYQWTSWIHVVHNLIWTLLYNKDFSVDSSFMHFLSICHVLRFLCSISFTRM